eukprot:gene2858-biopygen11711
MPIAHALTPPQDPASDAQECPNSRSQKRMGKATWVSCAT